MDKNKVTLANLELKVDKFRRVYCWTRYMQHDILQPQGLQGSELQGGALQGLLPHGSELQGLLPQGLLPQGGALQGQQPQGLLPQGSALQGLPPQGSALQGQQPQGSGNPVPHGSGSLPLTYQPPLVRKTRTLEELDVEVAVLKERLNLLTEMFVQLRAANANDLDRPDDAETDSVVSGT